MKRIIPFPSWLEEMFSTGKLCRNFNPKSDIIFIRSRNKLKHDITVGVFFDGPLLPTTEGASNRVYNLSKYLSLNGIKVLFFKCLRECDNIKTFRHESAKTGINFFLISPRLFYSYPPEYINRVLCKEKINFFQIKDPELLLALSLYLKSKSKAKICFDAHDVLHILLKRLGCNKTVINKTINNELLCNKQTYLHLCVSEIDKKHFIAIGCNKNKLDIISNGVDINEIKYNTLNLKSKTVLFLGNMCYFPNRYAVKIICKKIIPKVLEKDKDIRFLFVGSYDDKLKKYANENIKFMGTVKNLNTVFRKCSIAIAPLFHASGTRIKILHYFAAGLPVISTKIGAEGLHVQNYKNIVIEDNIYNYSKLIT